MRKTKLAAFLVLAFFAAMLSGTEAAFAAYPEKPIEWVIWASPGGGSDIFVRSLFSAARKDIGVNVNVTNLTGAAGVMVAISGP